MAKADTKIEKIVWVGLDFWLLKLMSNINLEFVWDANIEQHVFLVCVLKLVHEDIFWLQISRDAKLLIKFVLEPRQIIKLNIQNFKLFFIFLKINYK